MKSFFSPAGMLLIISALGVGCSGNQRITLFDAGRGDGDDAVSDGGAGDDGGGDGGTCPAGIRYCEGLAFYECGDDGATRTLIASCEDRCESPLGCVVCSPGTGRCDGEVSMRCSADGQRYDQLRDCESAGNRCGPSGFCEDACGEIEQTESNLGCRFTAVPLLVQETAITSGTFRIVIGNTWADEVAEIRVVRAGEEVAAVTVPPGAAEGVDLPWIEDTAFRFGSGFSPDASSLWESFVEQDSAYEVHSSVPVSVFQHSPGNTDGSASYSEASLLLPHHVLSGSFRVFAWPPFVDSDKFSFPSYVALTPAGSETVNVSLVASVDVLGAEGFFSSSSAGEPFELSLDPGQVAHVLPTDPRECLPSTPGAVQEPGRTRYDCPFADHDITNTVLTADGLLAVFSGHMNARVPINISASDHLQEQVPPTHTWGTEYVLVPVGDYSAVGREEVNVLRVLGSDRSSRVTFRPAVSGELEAEVPAEGFLEVTLNRTTTLRSDEPVLVAQYLVGAGYDHENPLLGDPSVFLPPPVDQFRKSYAFAVDGTFRGSGTHYAIFLRPVGEDVWLDGEIVAGRWLPAGAGEFEWRTQSIEPGGHFATSAERFGLVVAGVGDDESYSYSAGSDLRDIVTLR